MTEPHYYPGTTVPRNKLGLTDPQVLAEIEANTSAGRIAELARHPIDGAFDLEHLRAIHRAILGDLYDWAGEIRTIQTWAGDLGIDHDPPEVIGHEAHRIATELAEADFLRGRDHYEFTEGLAAHWGDMTSLHPFVDGNSRTQRVYIDQLARQAGWEIDWRAASPDAIQAARNFAYVDGGQILRDVLDPLVVPVGTVDLDAVAAPGRATDMGWKEHWNRMLEHFDTTPERPYTWSTQHTTPDAPAVDHQAQQAERQRAALVDAEREAERLRAAQRQEQARRRPPQIGSAGPHL